MRLTSINAPNRVAGLNETLLIGLLPMRRSGRPGISGTCFCVCSVDQVVALRDPRTALLRTA